MLRDARCNSSRLSTTKQDKLPRISRRPGEPSGARAPDYLSWVGRYGHPVAGAWIDSMLPAGANDPRLLACSHADHTGPAYAPLLICAVFDCRTNRLQRYCRAYCARLERQAPDAPRCIESGALPRSGCPNVSQSAADRRSTLEIDNRSRGRPEHRKHAGEGQKSDCA
jgi:hypothetical protein